jgi:OOP family OmpA-OmpF porin
MRGCVALAAGVALFAFASAASATDLSVPAQVSPDRFYVSFHGGYVFSTVAHDSATDGVDTLNSVVRAKPGYNLGGAVGSNFTENLAGELEISYASAAAANYSPPLPGPATGNLTGSASTITGMINAYLGADVGGFRPYVGAGIGIAYFTAHNIEDPGLPSPAGPLLNGSDTGFAAQFLAGVDFAVADNVMLGGRYRYLYINGLSLPDGSFTHSFNLATQSIEVVLTTKWQ